MTDVKKVKIVWKKKNIRLDVSMYKFTIQGFKALFY